MRKPMIILAAVALLIATLACGGSSTETPPTEQSLQATEEISEPTANQTDTPEPTSPPQPTATATVAATPTPEIPEDVIRVEVSESQDHGGVVITVEAVVLSPYEIMPDEFKSFTEDTDYWTDVQTVGAFQISVQNTTDQTINVHPDQGTVVVGNEQVDTALFMSDDVGGEILAGVMKDGAVLFGLKRQAPNEVTSVRYLIGGPFDNDFNDIGDDYEFEITISQ